ncbi:DUF7487 domain-containing protein [Paenibacillus cremeus]|uniref:DUF7487 domain-containing protein n=1 Tax=Paenibacillus cremeus TaxID=2163881 RepID=A0A559KCX2_9BACL|nr:hypothetical protein [Paenibacillus cremeus]TVY09988.1 hypothetical protein FPZ49_11495 [Paenibacillus cremeus]
MLILPQMVEVKWSGKIKTHFIEKGYEFTKLFDEFSVYILDLPRGSSKEIELICDYCLEDGIVLAFSRPYCHFVQSREISNKDCCRKCSSKKVAENTLAKYGVKNVNQLDEIKEKKKHINLERYGVEHYTQTEDYKEKVKKTNIEKYGVPYHIQSIEVRNRISKSNIDKYGVENVFANKEIIGKIKESNLKNHGFDNPMKNPEIVQKLANSNIEKYGVAVPLAEDANVKNKAKHTIIQRYGVDNYSKTEEYIEKVKATNQRIRGVDFPTQSGEVMTKVSNSFYKNGTGKTSKQQIYLNNLFGGKLNYSKDLKAMLDIAFPEEKIYVEYDGGGHWLSVAMGQISIEDFNKKELRRSFALLREGWKEIRIISKSDLLPLDSKLLEMLSIAKKYLSTGRHFIKFDIDENKIVTSQYEVNFDFGRLRKIKEKDCIQEADNIQASFSF